MNSRTVSALTNTAFIGLPTAAGGMAGYAWQLGQEITNNHATAVADAFAHSSATVTGVCAGVAIGGILRGIWWWGEHDPLPTAFAKLTSNRFSVIMEYPVSSGTFKVVQAFDKIENKIVVLKLPSLNRDHLWGSVNPLLEAEHSILSEIDSPHVVKALNMIRGWRYRILVLEHVNGLTLYDHFLAKDPFDFSDTLQFALAAARGLKALHDKGYRFGHEFDYERNIILDPERKAVFIDPETDKRSHGPRDEMELWARMVELASRKRTTYMYQNLHDEDERIKAFNRLIDCALDIDDIAGPANYQALVEQLESL